MRPRSALRALLAAVVVAASVNAEARDVKRLRIATDGAYPPFSRVDDGKAVGFDVDVARALCTRLAAECEVVAVGWDELVPQLLARRVDLVVASQPITEEARRRVEFTAAYHRIAPRFVARDTAIPIDPRPDAAKGRRIGVRAGTAHAAHLAAVYVPVGATVVPLAGETEMLEALLDGRVDLAFGDALVLYGLLDREFDHRGLRFVGEAVDSPRQFGAGAGITYRRDDPDLGRLLDKALVDLDRDGTLDRLAGRWFPFAIR